MLILSQIGREEVELRTTVTGFAPRLGVTLGFVQRRIHAAISRRYFARLIAESPVVTVAVLGATGVIGRALVP